VEVQGRVTNSIKPSSRFGYNAKRSGNLMARRIEALRSGTRTPA
jgi:hypothetical protein